MLTYFFALVTEAGVATKELDATSVGRLAVTVPSAQYRRSWRDAKKLKRREQPVVRAKEAVSRGRFREM
jgi:hypothetical protein